VVDGPEQSAAAIRAVLSGQSGPARDVIVANAAAALWVAGRGPSPAACVAPAIEAIDSGAAARLLARLVEFSNRRNF
jgi:anthranilate phosphoribosyltransferase